MKMHRRSIFLHQPIGNELKDVQAPVARYFFIRKPISGAYATPLSQDAKFARKKLEKSWLRISRDLKDSLGGHAYKTECAPFSVHRQSVVKRRPRRRQARALTSTKRKSGTRRGQEGQQAHQPYVPPWSRA